MSPIPRWPGLCCRPETYRTMSSKKNRLHIRGEETAACGSAGTSALVLAKKARGNNFAFGLALRHVHHTTPPNSQKFSAKTWATLPAFHHLWLTPTYTEDVNAQHFSYFRTVTISNFNCVICHGNIPLTSSCTSHRPLLPAEKDSPFSSYSSM